MRIKNFLSAFKWWIAGGLTVLAFTGITAYALSYQLPTSIKKGDVLYGQDSTHLITLSTGSPASVLYVNPTTQVPSYATLVNGTGIAINTSTPGQITLSATGGSGSITTSTTASIGKVAVWTGLATLGNGSLFDNGTVAGVNATSSTVNFNVKGSGTLNPFNVASSTGTSLLTVLATGNVGIGTASPAAKLDVNGSVLINGASAVSGIQLNVKGDSSAGVMRVDTGDGSGDAFEAYSISGAAGFQAYNRSTTNTVDFRGVSKDFYLLTGTAAANITERLRITSTGSTTLSSLAVAGLVRSTSAGGLYVDNKTYSSSVNSRTASSLGATLDCNLNTGTTSSGAACTDNSTVLNNFLAGASSTTPVELVMDGGSGISTTINGPRSGNWSIRGLGWGTGFFINASSSTNGISNIASKTYGPEYTSATTSVGSNISLSNFRLNGNRANNSTQADKRLAPNGNWLLGVYLDNVQYVTISHVWLYEIPTFNLTLNGCTDCIVDGNRFDAVSRAINQDGIHINGGSAQIRISNNWFNNTDDAIAANAAEGHGGTIDGVAVSNSQCVNCLTAYRQLSGESGGTINNSAVKNVTFTNGAGTITSANGIIGVAFRLGETSAGTSESADIMESVKISNSTYVMTSTDGYMVEQNENLGELQMSNVTWQSPVGVNGWLSYRAQATTTNFTCDNCHIIRTPSGSAAAYFINLSNNSFIKRADLSTASIQDQQGQSYSAAAYAVDVPSGTGIGTLLPPLDTNKITSTLNGSEWSRVTSGLNVITGVGQPVSFTSGNGCFGAGNAQITCSAHLFDNGGNIGINTTTATSYLVIQGASTSTQSYLTVATSTGATVFQVAQNTNGVSLGINTTTGTSIANIVGNSAYPTFAVLNIASSSGTSLFRVLANGNVGVGSTTPNYGFVANGTVAMPGLTTSSGLQTGVVCVGAGGQLINDSVACLASARRYKKDISNLPVGLEELLQLQPVQFKWKDDFNKGFENDPNKNGIQYSLIADDVQKVDPNLATVEKNGQVHGLADLNHWVALFVQSFKDMEKQITAVIFRQNTLEAKVEKQQVQIDHLQQQINLLLKLNAKR